MLQRGSRMESKRRQALQRSRKKGPLEIGQVNDMQKLIIKIETNCI
jgi:hypothetical protein